MRGSLAVIFGALGLLVWHVYACTKPALSIRWRRTYLFGLLMLSPDWTVTVRLILIGFILVMTGPTATHAIAARVMGEEPDNVKTKRKKRLKEGGNNVRFFVNAALISLLTLIAFSIRLHRLFAVVMLSALSSGRRNLIRGADAVDVAFTEAAVGAGIRRFWRSPLYRSCRPMKNRMILLLCPPFWPSPQPPCWPLRSPIYLLSAMSMHRYTITSRLII